MFEQGEVDFEDIAQAEASDVPEEKKAPSEIPLEKRIREADIERLERLEKPLMARYKWGEQPQPYESSPAVKKLARNSHTTVYSSMLDNSLLVTVTAIHHDWIEAVAELVDPENRRRVVRIDSTTAALMPHVRTYQHLPPHLCAVGDVFHAFGWRNTPAFYAQRSAIVRADPTFDHQNRPSSFAVDWQSNAEYDGAPLWTPSHIAPRSLLGGEPTFVHIVDTHNATAQQLERGDFVLRVVTDRHHKPFDLLPTFFRGREAFSCQHLRAGNSLLATAVRWPSSVVEEYGPVQLIDVHLPPSDYHNATSLTDKNLLAIARGGLALAKAAANAAVTPIRARGAITTLDRAFVPDPATDEPPANRGEKHTAAYIEIDAEDRQLIWPAGKEARWNRGDPVHVSDAADTATDSVVLVGSIIAFSPSRSAMYVQLDVDSVAVATAIPDLFDQARCSVGAPATPTDARVVKLQQGDNIKKFGSTPGVLLAALGRGVPLPAAGPETPAIGREQIRNALRHSRTLNDIELSSDQHAILEAFFSDAPVNVYQAGPGTGKTLLMAIIAAVANDTGRFASTSEGKPSQRWIVVSPTNVAADNITAALLATGSFAIGQVVRYYAASAAPLEPLNDADPRRICAHHEAQATCHMIERHDIICRDLSERQQRLMELPNGVAHRGKRLELIRKINQLQTSRRQTTLDCAGASIIIVTTAALSHVSRQLRRGDTLLFEEASQISVAEFLATVELVPGLHSIRLFGDALQLPPHTRGMTGYVSDVAMRSVQRALSGLSPEQVSPPLAPTFFLSEQRRAHPQLVNIFTAPTYLNIGQQLRSHSSTERLDGLRAHGVHLPTDAIPAAWIDVPAVQDTQCVVPEFWRSAKRRRTDQQYQMEAECRAALAVFKILVGAHFPPNKILILAFHTEVVTKMTNLLSVEGAPLLRSDIAAVDCRTTTVKTINSAQGAESDVVILILGRGDVESRTQDGHLGTSRSQPAMATTFVRDPTRMNVATSRARHAMFVVGDFAAMHDSHPWGVPAKAIHDHGNLLDVDQLVGIVAGGDAILKETAGLIIDEVFPITVACLEETSRGSWDENVVSDENVVLEEIVEGEEIVVEQDAGDVIDEQTATRNLSTNDLFRATLEELANN